MSDDLQHLFYTEEEVRRWSAERENASARLQLAQMKKSMATLISQYEPVNSLNIDREKLRHILNYVQHGDMSRLLRETKHLI